MPATVRSDTVRHIVSTARSLDCDLQRWVDANRWQKLRRAQRVPLRLLHSLWEHLAPLPNLAPTVAERLPLEALGVFGFAILSAPNALEALRSATIGYRLINGSVGLKLATGASPDRQVSLVWETPATTVGEARSHESIAAHFINGFRQLGVGGAVREVRFAHPAPPGARALVRWCGCRVRYNQRHTSIMYQRDALDGSPRLANRSMHEHFRAEVVAAVSKLLTEGTSFANRVQAVLVDGTDRSATEIASELGLSERTLRRTLERSGTSLTELRDEHRRRRLVDLLSDRSRSITDIAYELGFSEPSALSRACQRWYARSPSDLRRRISRSEIQD